MSSSLSADAGPFVVAAAAAAAAEQRRRAAVHCGLSLKEKQTGLTGPVFKMRLKGC